MSLNEILSQYGYFAVLIGSMLEGETVLTLAGYFVHQGYMSYPLTVACAAVGGTVGDQIFFFLGRRYGHQIVARFPKLDAPVKRVNGLIEKHHVSLIFGVRFMYGLRIAGPIAIGMSNVSIHRFVLLNALGAIVWATLIVTIGYVFGQTLQWLFDDLKQYEEIALVLVVVIIVAVILIRRRRKKLPH